ncbi:endonuclease domain-containing 1 protein [Danio rerio]|uniref:Endonuclease domain-containing 1 protein n=1 Tax=Danio rerio TaxID=7955 RepID=B0R0N8_DANRE|nr:endonuclease domain-containing 1 protein [Danio rerio]|eukprot:XP_009292242.1 endonuclease domain-containing 1 protein [Danio rerio]
MKMHLLVISALLVFSFPFITPEVVDSFSKCSQFFLNGEPPVISGLLEGSVSLNDNHKIICQKYQNLYTFATFYSIKFSERLPHRIPVFSAYKYTGSYKGRPRLSWMIEPQLESSDNSEMRAPCVNQAEAGDYYTKDIYNISRGHLFPNGHAADNITAESTFTLTNIVPQVTSFNNGSWVRMEQKVRSIIESDCRDRNNPEKTLAYVLTGAVPSKSNFLRKRVNIPTHMWTAFCCYNSTGHTWVSQAHWGENKREGNPIDIPTRSLDKLEQFLKKQYNRNYKLFKNNCFQTQLIKTLHID